MKTWTMTSVCTAALVLSGAAAQADDEKRAPVTASFGVGLNTAQPGNSANHHILPQDIHVKTGSVVNFVVAGFHQIYVYQPGVKLEDIIVPDTGLFVNDHLDHLYYPGILPAGGPPPGFPATVNPSNAVNRVESVAFLEPGVYLVICNVRDHLTDGMWAYVKVTGKAPR
jgi:uncharacterized cupredoxin-like copper-binding protein